MDKVTREELKELLPHNSITPLTEGVFRIDGGVKSKRTRNTLRILGFKQYAPYGETGHSYWTNMEGHDAREIPNID